MGERATTAARTPAKPPSTSKKSATSTGKQQSILGFFGKSASAPGSSPASSAAARASNAANASPCLRDSTNTKSNARPVAKRPAPSLTPVPSSDAAEPISSQENIGSSAIKVVHAGLPSPTTPAELPVQQAVSSAAPIASSSPSRKVKPSFLTTSACSSFSHSPRVNIGCDQSLCAKTLTFVKLQAKKSVNYAESSDDDEDIFNTLSAKQARRRKMDRPRARTAVLDEEDEDEYQLADEGVNDGDGMYWPES